MLTKFEPNLILSQSFPLPYMKQISDYYFCMWYCFLYSTRVFFQVFPFSHNMPKRSSVTTAMDLRYKLPSTTSPYSETLVLTTMTILDTAIFLWVQPCIIRLSRKIRELLVIFLSFCLLSIGCDVVDDKGKSKNKLVDVRCILFLNRTLICVVYFSLTRTWFLININLYQNFHWWSGIFHLEEFCMVYVVRAVWNK